MLRTQADRSSETLERIMRLIEQPIEFNENATLYHMGMEAYRRKVLSYVKALSK